MSKIRVNRWETLDGIGAGVIYVDTVADLQALDTSGLVEGQAASVQGSEFRWSGGEWLPIGPVNVKAFGAVGDGVNDDLPALKAAIDFAPEDGMTILFPNGTYYTPRASVLDIDSWLLIEKNNISLTAESVHGAVLENIIILARGRYGDKFKLGEPLVSGEKTVTTDSSHNFSLNSYVQLLSGINAYSSDAGEWQGGSVSPSTLSRSDTMFSEIHRVAYVGSDNKFDIYDEVIFPVYNPDTSGQSVVIEGVDGAYAREVFPVKNFECRGLTFKRQEGSSFRGVHFLRTVGGGIYKCKFLTNDGDDGRHIRTQESKNWTMRDCIEFRNPVDDGGSSWNSVFISGGSQDVKILNNTFHGGGQVIDVTTSTDSNILFGEPVDHGPDGVALTCHSISISGNYITGCRNAFTTHPAVYNVSVSGNIVETGGVGFRLRSRKNVVMGNNIRTQRIGVVLSAFYDDTIVLGNNIEQIAAIPSGDWVGFSAVPLSSEIMNNNDVKNVIFTGNTVSSDTSGSTSNIHGVRIRHAGEGAPPNENFEEFTSSVKTAVSDYLIKGNTFNGCGITIGRYINGVSVCENHFRRSRGIENWVRGFDTDSVRHSVLNNYFYSASSSSFIHLKDETTESYSYSVSHNVGAQFGISTSVSLDVPEDSAVSSIGSQLVRHDGLTMLSSGDLKAVRSEGGANVNIFGQPLDGVSRSQVRINTSSGTDDNRLINNGQFIQENGDVRSRPDNENSLGTAADRWSEVFSANGTINTSDAREKQRVSSLSDAESAAASELKGMIRKFKWNHAVEKKGDDARWHFGVMAQEVAEVFGRHGLDAHDYGLFCYDEWGEQPEEIDEETGEIVEEYRPAGNRYGVRYDQLLAFIISAM